MEDTKQKVSLSSSVLQHFHQPSNNGAARTVLKSTSSAKARLELADMTSYHSRRLGSLSTINNGWKPKEVRIDQQPVDKNDSSNRNRTEVRNTSSSTSSEIDSTEDNSSLNLSFICNSSMLQNVSVDDINISVLAHDGSGDMLVPPFHPVEVESSPKQHIKIPNSTLEDNHVQVQRDLDQIQRNCTKAIKTIDSVVHSNVTLPGSNQYHTNKNEVSSLGLEVASELSNNNTLCEPEDRENSMEISFDESRGAGPICSSDVGIELEPFSEFSTATEKTDNDGLTTVVTTESATATSTSSSASTTNATASNFTDTYTANCNTKNTDASSTADINLTELARAKNGNPENLYGLLAGFIKTGKHSNNTITINLSQCYNCDGSCVRNTISVLSQKNENLKVVKEGIVNVENLHENRPSPNLIQDSVLQPCNSRATTEPELDASKRAKKKKHLKKSKSSILSRSSNLVEVEGRLIPVTPRSCPKFRLKAPTFTPYDVDVTSTERNKQLGLETAEAEILLSSPALSVRPLEISSETGLSSSFESNEVNKNSTFVVSNYTDTSNTIVDNQQNQNQHPQSPCSSVYVQDRQNKTKDVIQKSKTSNATVNLKKKTVQLKRGRKKGTKITKKKLKTKQISMPRNEKCSAGTETSLQANTQLMTQKTQFVSSSPPPAENIRRFENTDCPILSPQVEISKTRLSRTKPKILYSKQDQDQDYKGRIPKLPSQSQQPEYLELYQMDITEEHGIKNIVYSCKKCEFTTVQSVTSDRKLKSHFERHKKPTQFKCTHCPKVFTAVSSTTRHILKCKKNPHSNRANANKNKTKKK